MTSLCDVCTILRPATNAVRRRTVMLKRSLVVFLIDACATSAWRKDMKFISPSSLRKRAALRSC